ncbi:hypothetical protein M8J77_010296 [Diaphorina citri]|nr:hypothetical protein M8J77_010296 [Diaphorina citri]
MPTFDDSVSKVFVHLGVDEHLFQAMPGLRCHQLLQSYPNRRKPRLDVPEPKFGRHTVLVQIVGGQIVEQEGQIGRQFEGGSRHWWPRGAVYLQDTIVFGLHEGCPQNDQIPYLGLIPCLPGERLDHYTTEAGSRKHKVVRIRVPAEQGFQDEG